MPHENCSLGSNGDKSLLVWRDADFGDVTRVANSLVVADTFIVVPKADSLVLTSRDEVLTCLCDCKGIDLASL